MVRSRDKHPSLHCSLDLFFSLAGFLDFHYFLGVDHVGGKQNCLDLFGPVT